MSIAAAVCTSFKAEVLQGIHQPGHVYKIALFTSSANLDYTTTGYTSSGESSGTGYTAGGATLDGYDVESSGTTAWLTFSNPSWTTATITARGALIYNSTLPGKNAICVIDFGANISSTAGTFSITFPASDASNALIRLT